MPQCFVTYRRLLLMLFVLTMGSAADAKVASGIDVLVAGNFAPLEGARVGLITNHTGMDRDDVSTIRRFHDAEGVTLVSLFSPEHGIEGTLDIPLIGDTTDRATGLRVYSLYGDTRRPTPDMLRGIDTLVFDIQDIGTRFYTYISTMLYAMEAAADHGLRFVVLDRPNPIGGLAVAGPLLDPDRRSFVGVHPIALRHGMTIGELAAMFRAELELDLELSVVTMRGWSRGMLFDDTGLQWINPSPNMRSLDAALLYPGIGLLETTNLSVGRGTATPFEHIGAPWLDGERLARELTALELPGIEFRPVSFTPDASVFDGERCFGVGFEITDRRALEPVTTGFAVAHFLKTLHPLDWEPGRYMRLLGHQASFDAVNSGATPDAILASYRHQLDEFEQRRARFLLYD